MKKKYIDLGAITKDGKFFFRFRSWPVNEKTFWQFIDFVFENYYSSLDGLKGKLLYRNDRGKLFKLSYPSFAL